MRAIVIGVALVACAHPQARVAVRVPELMRNLDPLGQDGRTELATVVISRTGGITAGDRETVFVGQTVTFDGKSTSLTDLVVGCGPFAAQTPCKLAGRGDKDLVVLRTLDANDPGAVTEAAPHHDDPKDDSPAAIIGVLSLVSFAGMGICIGVCESDKTEKSIALGAAGGVLGLLWLLMSTPVHD
jgi:hypothetical protein